MPIAIANFTSTTLITDLLIHVFALPLSQAPHSPRGRRQEPSYWDTKGMEALPLFFTNNTCAHTGPANPAAEAEKLYKRVGDFIHSSLLLFKIIKAKFLYA